MHAMGHELTDRIVVWLRHEVSTLLNEKLEEKVKEMLEPPP